MRRKVNKRGKRNVVFRSILAKGDKDEIAAWNQDLVRILHVFNVRSTCSCRKHGNSSVPLSGRAGDRHEHQGRGHPNEGCRYPNEGSRYSNEGCRYPNDGCGYPSKYLDRTKWRFQSKPLGRCDALSINFRMLTDCLASGQVSDTEIYGVRSLTFS
jgi:hypothetical protein